MSPAALRLAPTPAARRQRKRRDRLAAGVLLVPIELDADTLDGLARLGHDVSSAEVRGPGLSALLKDAVTRDRGGLWRR
jgi:hypothetical protein